MSFLPDDISFLRVLFSESLAPAFQTSVKAREQAGKRSNKVVLKGTRREKVLRNWNDYGLVQTIDSADNKKMRFKTLFMQPYEFLILTRQMVDGLQDCVIYGFAGGFLGHSATTQFLRMMNTRVRMLPIISGVVFGAAFSNYALNRAVANIMFTSVLLPESPFSDSGRDHLLKQVSHDSKIIAALESAVSTANLLRQVELPNVNIGTSGFEDNNSLLKEDVSPYEEPFESNDDPNFTSGEFSNYWDDGESDSQSLRPFSEGRSWDDIRQDKTK